MSSDAVGDPTLGAVPFTLGNCPLFNTFVNSFIIFACFSFVLVDPEKVSFATFNSSAAAMSAMYSSKFSGILQRVGNNFVVLAICVACVVGIQNR